MLYQGAATRHCGGPGVSNSALNAVFGCSESKGVARNVMFAIADRINKETGTACCSAEDIAKRANILAKNVPRIIEKLSRSGELSVERRAGPRCSNIYRILLSPLRVRVPQGDGALQKDPLMVSKRPPHGEPKPPQGEGQTLITNINHPFSDDVTRKSIAVGSNPADDGMDGNDAHAFTPCPETGQRFRQLRAQKGLARHR